VIRAPAVGGVREARNLPGCQRLRGCFWRCDMKCEICGADVCGANTALRVGMRCTLGAFTATARGTVCDDCLRKARHELTTRGRGELLRRIIGEKEQP